MLQHIFFILPLLKVLRQRIPIILLLSNGKISP